MSESLKPASEAATNFSSYNKLHWMLGGESYSLRIAKEMFVSDLRRAQAQEKAACDKSHTEPGMTEPIFTRICGILDQCQNFYEVEALARFVFDDNYIPDYDGPDGVRQRGHVFHMLMPTYEILRANPNPRRSF
jgi:hypothetical protein